MRLYVPTPRQTNLLLLIGFAAFGYALYLRFLVVEASSIEFACAEGLPRAVCGLRKVAVELYELQFFGGAALVFAILHFARPRFIMLVIALTAAVLGLVLSNTGVSALAAAILVMAFARPAHANKSMPAPATARRATGPASSSTSH